MELLWLLILAVPILGHVLYGLPPSAEEAHQQGVSLHNGDDFAPSDQPPHPERLERARGVTADGGVSLAVDGDRVTGVTIESQPLTQRPAWTVVETPKTFIELAATKFASYLQHEGLGHVLEYRTQYGEADAAGREIYSKYVKTALSHPDGSLSLLTAAVGLPIEIVPLDAGPIRPGQNISIQVFVAGVPASDLQVRVSHREPTQNTANADLIGRTDSDGVFTAPIIAPGFWRFHAISMQRIARDGADWESLWASLTFRL
jgi:hypothetical protein